MLRLSRRRLSQFAAATAALPATARAAMADSYQFDPETLTLLVEAYDRTMQALHDRGQPELVREVIAKRIIALAGEGERNPDRLSRAALAAVGLPE